MKSYYKIYNTNLRKKKINIGDKSISHRAIIISFIKKCTVEIYNILESNDIFSTINLCKNLGINIYGPINNYIYISSLNNKKNKKKINFLGNSGTTTRITLSILLINKIIIGDKSLNKRTMYRIIKPLSLLGFIIQSKKNHYLPIILYKKNNIGLKYNLINTSSQIKSCLLLSSIYSFVKINIIEIKITRDHSERFLKKKKKNFLIYKIPNDISSIIYFISYCIIKKKTYVLNFNFNKLRSGIMDFLIFLNLKIIFIYKKIINEEHVVKLIIYKKKLINKILFSKEISRMIDEVPILVITLLYIRNIKKIYGLEELQYKESNRLTCIIKILMNLGIKIIKKKNYISFKGLNIHLNFINSYNDHRLFMCSFILNIHNKKISNLENTLSSFPNFIFNFYNTKNKYYVNIK